MPSSSFSSGIKGASVNVDESSKFVDEFTILMHIFPLYYSKPC
jgi:hypothetical protein